jgi:hypothetical protein
VATQTEQGSAPADQIAQFRSDGVTATTGLRIPFMVEEFSEASGLPPMRLVNMISEATPIREERPYTAYVGLREIRYSRPGLVSAYNIGTGPIRGLYFAPPALGGFLVIVSGGTAYNAATGASLGAVPGTDLVRFAKSALQLIAVAGGVAYLLDGTTSGVLRPIVSSVLPPVSDVAWLTGRFVFTCTGSDTFFFSAVNDAANVTGLNFATAESDPDATRSVAVLDDGLVFFGSASLEFWIPSADAAAPFQPITGRSFQRGSISRDAAVFADNSMIWVANNRVVYRITGGIPQKVSSASIDDKLRQCPNIGGVSGWVATFGGHEFFVLTVPGVGTYAYDLSRSGTQAGAFGDSFGRGEWGEWQSYGRQVFRGRVAAVLDGTVYVGDDVTADVWLMSAGTYTDAGGALTREASAFIKVEEGTPRCDALILHCVVGVGNITGAGSSPVAEMRFSDDQGKTFSRWRQAPLGATGRSLTRTSWRRLGQMRAPGRLIEIRVTDPVNATFSHLELNPTRPAD